MVVKPKTKVTKSKSSSSALATRPYSTKKGRTKPVFPAHGAMKRRGAYVENKTTKSLDTHTRTDISQTGKRTLQPSRSGRKRFPTSVLSISSNDCIRFQNPGRTDSKKDKIEITKIANNRNKIIDTQEDTFETEDKIVDDISSFEFRNRVQDKKKKKYRSKILNEYINKDKFEVLQTKKTVNMSITPSIGSDFEKEEMNWMGFPRLVNDYGSEEKDVNELVKHISEGRQSKEKVLKQDPSTLVAGNKDDKKLYNFFVDILETTLSVYNVKTEFNKTASNVSSKVALEIDESVAKKLRFTDVENQLILDDVTQKPSRAYYTITGGNTNCNEDKEPLLFETKRRECQTRATSTKKRTAISGFQRRREELSTSLQRRRLKSDSFDYPRNKTFPLKSQSAVISERSSLYKKNKKRDLLNMLREQLKMEDYHYDEPRTLFDALRVMVRNKKKNEKILRFEPNKDAIELRDECMLKRRKIITSTSNFKYPKPIQTRQSEITAIRRKPTINVDSTDSEASNHSLEVYGFDYNTSTSSKSLNSPKMQKYHFTRPSYYSSDYDSEDVTNEIYS